MKNESVIDNEAAHIDAARHVVDVSDENISVVDVDDGDAVDFVIVDDNGDDAEDVVALDYDYDNGGDLDISIDANNHEIVDVYVNVGDDGHAEEIIAINPDDVLYDGQDVAVIDEQQAPEVTCDDSIQLDDEAEEEMYTEEEQTVDAPCDIDNEYIDDYNDTIDGLI